MRNTLNHLLRILVVPVLALLLTGCATILGGRSNSFVFSGSYPPDAEILLNDSVVGVPPGKIVLAKRLVQHGSILEIRAEGYATQEYLILRKVHPLYTAADVFTGIVPLIVDTGTGNLYRPSPRKFDQEMKKEESP